MKKTLTSFQQQQLLPDVGAAHATGQSQPDRVEETLSFSGHGFARCLFKGQKHIHIGFYVLRTHETLLNNQLVDCHPCWKVCGVQTPLKTLPSLKAQESAKVSNIQ